MTQNVPFIVAQHLNTVKHNTSAIRGLAQLSCGSKLSKQRQAIPAICESDVRGLAWAIPAQAQSEKVRRIRLRFDSGYSERHRRNNLRQLVVRSTKIYSWTTLPGTPTTGFRKSKTLPPGTYIRVWVGHGAHAAGHVRRDPISQHAVFDAQNAPVRAVPSTQSRQT